MRSSNFLKIAVCLVMLSVCLAVNAFAATAPQNYSSIAIVDGDGSSNTPAAFNWNETPWLYVAFTTRPGNTATGQTTSSWYAPSGAVWNLDLTSPNEADRTYNLYMSFSDWTSKQEAGIWTVETTGPRLGTHIDGETFQGANQTFKVNAVPEPISSALFLLGGAVLGIKRFKKRSV